MNLFATITLAIFPIVAGVFYSTKPVGRATILTFLIAQLVLPVGASIKIEMIPVIDKGTVASFTALAGCLLSARRPFAAMGGFGLVEFLLALILIGPFITGMLNTDAYFVGGTVMPANDLYEALSSVESAFILIIPFLLGRRFLRGSADFEMVLRALVVAWLIYSVLILFEWRMSPKLNGWFYGFSPGLNIEVREGGMRPRVFMGNGLLLAFYEMTAVVAAAALWKAGIRIVNFSSALFTAYLGFVLVLCRSLGALIYGIILVPLVRFTQPKFQLCFAVGLVVLALTYPVLRAANLFPTEQLVEMANSINEERARSLNFRFIQEDQLLKHASERFYFGWGQFGRNRVISEDGEDHSVTDGTWILTMGQFGFVGFLAQFGLVAWAVLRALAALKFVSSEQDRVFLAAMGLIVAVNLVEGLPNAPITPWTILLSGALLGRTEEMRAMHQKKKRRNSRIELELSEQGAFQGGRPLGVSSNKGLLSSRRD